MAIRQSSQLVADGQILRARYGPTAGNARNLAPHGLLDGHSFITTAQDCAMSTTWLKTLNSGTFVTTAGAVPGLVTVTTNASSQALCQAQESYDGGTTAWAQYVPTAGVEAYFEADVKLSEVTTGGFIFGFAEVDTTVLATGAIDVAGFVGLYKATGAATLVGTVCNASTATNTSTLKTVVADTFVKLGCRINGVSSVEFFIDGVKTIQTTMTNIPTGNLAFTWGYSGNAKVFTYKNMFKYITGLRS